MISFESVTFTYPEARQPLLRDVSVSVPEGELALVVGPTGSGKSTLLNLVNGLVPHFTGGTLQGRVRVAGRCTADHPPREMADLVGVVRQDPQTGFVTDVVEDELAYTMESLAIAPAVMRRRVEETLDLLGLAALRNRPLRSLSGGERQRVAIGSVLTAHPQVLVLDEPTSALDPQAAEEVLAAVQRLVHDLSLTVLMSEHRLERVVQYADSVVTVGGDGRARLDPSPASAMLTSPVRPPVVDLGLLAGWRPLPLSIRDARRSAADLRRDLRHTQAEQSPRDPGPVGSAGHAIDTDPVACLTRAGVVHGGTEVLRAVDLVLRPGEVVALMGRNGAGKTSLLNLLAGVRRPSSGAAAVLGRDPTALQGSELLHTLGFVPQEPGMMLWAESVAEECSAADTDSGQPAGTAAAILDELRPGVDPHAHPGDLSEGTRLALVLAIMLAARPPLLLLDEPTRGLDYPAKARLAEVLRTRAAAGATVLVATHDVELVAELCTRVVMLADAEVVVDADARSTVTSSPVFAPQVAKVMAPLPLLTVAEVRVALAHQDTAEVPQ